MSFKQRLALQIFAATNSRMDQANVSFPYGFEKYAKAAAKCKGKKLDKHPMYVGSK